MPFSLIENWDAATPPAIPAAWSVGTPFVTSASFAFSSPNSLKLGTATSGTRYYATNTTADSGAGMSIDLTSLIYFPTGASSGDVVSAGPTYRCSAAPMDNSTTSCYWTYLSANTSGTNTLVLAKIVNGTLTTLTSIADTHGGVVLGGWYAIRVVLATSSFNVVLTRMADGYTMNGAGLFVSGTVSAISGYTDTSIASGSYYGLAATSTTAIGTASNRIYLDDLTVNATGTPTINRPRDPVLVRWPFQYYHPD